MSAYLLASLCVSACGRGIPVRQTAVPGIDALDCWCLVNKKRRCSAPAVLRATALWTVPCPVPHNATMNAGTPRCQCCCGQALGVQAGSRPVANAKTRLRRPRGKDARANCGARSRG
ncbi:unnamed protein product [Miscanthus lutarioriparius]|uniref:Secreted protein n=1 Tax=Miscanthus lutarioriparius TaxID=422564 RepID=A0A811NXM0_9POAL|nr:unnamed protein product [Miscanthus lutarioriparius]